MKKYQQLELNKNANEVKDLSNLKYVKSEPCNDVSFGQKNSSLTPTPQTTSGQFALFQYKAFKASESNIANMSDFSIQILTNNLMQVLKNLSEL